MKDEEFLIPLRICNFHPRFSIPIAISSSEVSSPCVCCEEHTFKTFGVWGKADTRIEFRSGIRTRRRRSNNLVEWPNQKNKGGLRR